MAKLGFTIAGAAKTAGVTEAAIIDAVRSKELVARRVDDNAVILGSDIQVWLEAQPRY